MSGEESDSHVVDLSQWPAPGARLVVRDFQEQVIYCFLILK